MLDYCRGGERKMQRGGHDDFGEKGMFDLQVMSDLWYRKEAGLVDLGDIGALETVLPAANQATSR